MNSLQGGLIIETNGIIGYVDAGKHQDGRSTTTLLSGREIQGPISTSISYIPFSTAAWPVECCALRFNFRFLWLAFFFKNQDFNYIHHPDMFKNIWNSQESVLSEDVTRWVKGQTRTTKTINLQCLIITTVIYCV